MAGGGEPVGQLATFLTIPAVQRHFHKHKTSWLDPLLSVGRTTTTFVSAVLTWMTILHFAADWPIELFQGWIFTLIGLMVFSSIAVACTKTTAVILHHLWSFREGRIEGKWSWRHSRLIMFPLLLVITFASLFLHGGAIVTDCRMILAWKKWRAAAEGMFIPCMASSSFLHLVDSKWRDRIAFLSLLACVPFGQ